MKYSSLKPKKTGAYATDVQTTVDIGDVIKLKHSDGTFFAEVIAIETGDAGETLFFEYIEPRDEFSSSPYFLIKRPFFD